MQVQLREALRAHGGELASTPLTLVVAPAGSGKSTLARAWQDDWLAAGGRMAWLSLADLHRDPNVFVEDLVEAIRDALPEALEGAEPFGTGLLRSLPRSGEIEPEPIVRLLDRELRGLASPLVVCLDALEHLDRDGISLEVIDRLLRAQPRWLRVVITTRGLQPRVASRMRAEDRAVEFDADDLSLRSDQVARVLEEAGVALADHQAAQLLARTEGWAIAIRFAARALSGVPEGERARFIEELVQQRDLFRYIASELVTGIPTEIIAVLEVSSVLGAVDRETLGAAVDAPDVWTSIDEAIEVGLLLQTTGDALAAHELLAEWLRLRLESRLEPDAWRALHHRLGRLVEQRGREMNALRIYRSAGLQSAVVELLSRSAHAWVNRGHYDLASEALAELPAELRSSDPALIAVAGVIECGRDPDTAVESLRRAIEMYRKAGNRAAEFEALHELAIIAFNENRVQEMIDIFRYALTLRRVFLEPRLRGMVVLAIADGSMIAGRYAFSLRLLGLADTYEHAPRERSGISLVRGMINFHRGDWDRVITEVEERCAEEVLRDFGPGFFAMQIFRCAARGLRGEDLAGCRAILEEASQLFTTAHQSLHHLTCELAHGQILLRAGEPMKAIGYFERAATVARRTGLREAEAASLGFLARAHQTAGEAAPALEAALLGLALIERGDTWSSRFSLAPFWGAGAALAAVVCAELGEAQRAWAILEGKRRRLEHRELPLYTHSVRLLVARVAECAGEERPARRLLAKGWRLRRDASLVDRGPELDDPLWQWAEERATAQRVETGLPGPLQQRAAGRASERLRIESLGGLTVQIGDRRVTDRAWRGATARRLLIRLLMADGRPLARERIETDLWPEASASSARNSLKVALSRLRDALEPRRRRGQVSRFIEVEGERVSLSEAALAGWDVHDVREAIAALDRSVETSDVEAAREALARLTSLWQGDLLPESYDDWTLELRRSLEERWLRSAKNAVAHFVSAGESEVAVAIATALVASQREDEGAWEALVEALIASGDRGAARRALDDARQVLADRLGVDPGERLVALEGGLDA